MCVRERESEVFEGWRSRVSIARVERCERIVCEVSRGLGGLV